MRKKKIMSEKKTVKSIYEILAEIQAEVISVTKDTKAYSYKYAKIDGVIDELHPYLKKLGAAITSTVVSDGGEFELVTRLHFGEQVIPVTCPLADWRNTLQGKNNPMQSMGAAISYARRYNLLSMFNMYQAEDNDAADLNIPPPPPPPKKATQAVIKPVDTSKVDTLETAKEYFLKFGPSKGKKVSDLTVDEAQRYIDSLKTNNDKLRSEKKDIPVESVLALVACQKWVDYNVYLESRN